MSCFNTLFFFNEGNVKKAIYFQDTDLSFLWNCSLFPAWRRKWQPTPVLLPRKSHGWRSLVGCSPWGSLHWTRLSDFSFTFHFHALEKEMATHSSVLAWRIPGVEEPGRLPSMGSHRVGHDWSELAAAAAAADHYKTIGIYYGCWEAKRWFWAEAWQDAVNILTGPSWILYWE